MVDLETAIEALKSRFPADLRWTVKVSARYRDGEEFKVVKLLCNLRERTGYLEIEHIDEEAVEKDN